MPGNFYTITLQDIASWPVPNYTNPVERTWLPIYAIVWQVLTSVLVIGRLYLRLKGRAGLDDLFLFISWVFSIGFTVTACKSVWEFDVGRHIWDVRPDRYEGALFTAWLAQVMFIFSTGAIKTSVLLFYRRIAKDYSKKWLYTIWTLLIMTIGTWISVFFAYCFMCTPLSTYWRIAIVTALGESYHCIDGDALTISTGVLTIASDIWTVLVPCLMFQFHDLGVTKRQKIGLNLIFCLGFLVTGGGIARTYYLWQFGNDQDAPWVGYNLFVASIAECQLAIVCTCAPFLRAFFRRHAPTIRNMTKSSKAETMTETVDSRNSANFSKPKIRWSEPGSYKYMFDREAAMEIDTRTSHEKKGPLVVEEGHSRIVWDGQPGSSHYVRMV